MRILRSLSARTIRVEDEEDQKAEDASELRDSVLGVLSEKVGDRSTNQVERGEVVEILKPPGKLGESKRSDGMECDVEEKEKTGKEVRGSDVMVPLRVLRSRVVMGKEIKKTDEVEESESSLNVKFRGSTELEESSKRGGAEQEVGGDKLTKSVCNKNQENEELLGESLKEKSTRENFLKRKRGRPPKLSIHNKAVTIVQDGWSEKTLVDESRENSVEENSENKDMECVQAEESVGGENLKKRRGRPSKKKISNVNTLVDGELRDVNEENLEMRMKSKRKRRRPPKLEIYDDNVYISDDDTSLGGRGRNVAVEESGNEELEPAKVERGHEGSSDGANSKRRLRRRPKSQISDEVTNKGDEGGSENIARENISMGTDEQSESCRTTRRSVRLEKERVEKGLDNSDEPATQLGSEGLAENPIEEGNTSRSGIHRHGPKSGHDVKEGKAYNLRSDVLEDKKQQLKKSTEGDETMPRSEAKQKVREKIVKMLLEAGWSIKYRQRNNREYNDAVYVSPGGRSCWSVTKAYKVLKRECEKSNGPLQAAQEDVVFHPLPQEELDLLARISVKKREYKGNRKAKYTVGENKVVEVPEKKKQKCEPSIPKQDNAPERRKHDTHSLRRPKPEVKSDDHRNKKTILTWLIDSGTVPEYSRVMYMNQKKQKVKHQGTITRDGIECDCCDEIFILSEFEKHAGSQLCKPYQNIYLESGSSLLECLIKSWRNEVELFENNWFHLVDVHNGDPNDNTCNLCGDGGDLICCDDCPSTFHLKCLALKDCPLGDWKCFRCTCKYCVSFDGSLNQRDSDDDIVESSLYTCRLCEEKYHKDCIQETSANMDDTAMSTFCGKKCEEIFKRLQPLLGVQQQLEDGFSWRLIQRTEVDSDVSRHETQKNLEGNSELAVALSVMNECFLPLVDQRTGVNLMRNIMYSCGSNFTRLNYTGFYAALLERDDEVIAAACIRIHGHKFAEMPFIGVRDMYRRQGMCRRLVGAIESGLCSLLVEKLIIPAVDEVRETWTSSFGFKSLRRSTRLQMRNMNILVFPETNMLEKSLLKK